MAKPLKVPRKVKWNSADHPRDRYGKFASKSLMLGSGQTLEWGGPNGEQLSYICNQYGNNPATLNPGNAILHMAARGKVFSKVDDPAIMRVHMMSDDDGNLMSVAGSEHGAFIVTDHNTDGFDVPHSLSRGNAYQPQPQNLAEGETAWGGRAAALTGRSDGKTYNTLNARRAAAANEAAFEADGAQVCTIDPGDLADRVADVRRFYEDKCGMSRREAENTGVYVYINGNGEMCVRPSMVPDEKNPGQMRLIKTPNTKSGTKAGGHAVKIPAKDITRMARAMQAESGMDNVEFTVSHGTQTADNGKPIGNALHFRSNYVSPTNHHEITMRGTIENSSHGVDEVQARSKVANPDGTMNFEKRRELDSKRAARRRRDAEPYRHPTTTTDAERFWRKLHGSTRDTPGRAELLEGDRFTFRTGSGYDTVFSGDTGRAVGVSISSKQGAAFHAMTIRHGGIMPTEDQISVRKGKARKTKRDIPDVYTVHWADGKVDRFTADGEPYTDDRQFD